MSFCVLWLVDGPQSVWEGGRVGGGGGLEREVESDAGIAEFYKHLVDYVLVRSNNNRPRPSRNYVVAVSKK